MTDNQYSQISVSRNRQHPRLASLAFNLKPLDISQKSLTLEFPANFLNETIVFPNRYHGKRRFLRTPISTPIRSSSRAR